MNFNTQKEKEEFFYLKPKAKILMCCVDQTSLELFNKPIIVTKVFYEGMTGIHADFRAFDIRRKNYYTRAEVETLRDTINRHFVYDPKRPKKKTCVVEEDHVHLQVWVK